MRYVCLIYDDEKNWEKMPKPDADAMMGEYFAFTEDIKKNGHYHAGEALQPVGTATTVRVRNGKTVDHRRSLCRDQGAAGRLLPHRRPGPERGHPDRVARPVRTDREHRGPPRNQTSTSSGDGRGCDGRSGAIAPSRAVSSPR